MSSSDNRDIILASLAAAGAPALVEEADPDTGEIVTRTETDAEWRARVADNAVKAAATLNPKSRFGTDLDQQIEDAGADPSAFAHADIILAAIAAAGDPADDDDDAWEERVAASALRLASAVKPKSAIGQSISDALERIESAKVFSANVLGGRPEASSKRMIVEIAVKPTEGNPTGEEEIRTDPKYTPEGAAMMRKIRTLKNRRVLVYKINEKWKRDPNRNTRVLVHVEDIGEAREFSADES